MQSADVPFLRQIVQAAPAVGADWRYVGPGQGIQRVVALRAVLATSAAVANRAPALILSDGTDDFAVIPATSTVAASQSSSFSCIPGSVGQGAANGPFLWAAPADGWMLPPGWSLRASTALLDAGDQWSSLKIWAIEYPTGPRGRITPDVYSFFTPQSGGLNGA